MFASSLSWLCGAGEKAMHNVRAFWVQEFYEMVFFFFFFSSFQFHT